VNHQDPVLKQALKGDWHLLAPAIRAHYDLAPFTDQQVLVEGRMENVTHSARANLLIPFARLAGALIPFVGSNVPVRVINYSRPHRPDYYWDRVFSFPGRKPFRFASRMVCSGDHEITEYVRLGFGLRLRVSVQDGALIETDRGYVLTMGKLSIPVPLNALMGSAYIEESPVNSDAFDMRMTLKHRVFGETFAYNGRFALATQ